MPHTRTILMMHFCSQRARIRRHRACDGFTLLELMVVLVLIGIIFTFAVLSFGGDDLAEAMEQETRRLVTLIDMAAEEAVLRGEELAIHFTENDYTFMTLQSDGWQAPEDDRLLKAHTLPEGITIGLDVEGEPPISMTESDEEDSDIPQVFLLSSGEMTAFSLTFEADQSRFRYHLTATMMGELEWEVEEVF